MSHKSQERLRQMMSEMPHKDSANSVVCLLYLLMRDHLPVGVVNKLVSDSSTPSTFTDGHLAGIAERQAEFLLRDRDEEKTT